MARLAGFVALFLAFGGSAAAHPRVDEGRRLYEDLEYKKALLVLVEAAGTPGLTREETIIALHYLGLCQATLNDLGGAAQTFKRLLDIDPDFSLDRSTTPRVFDLFLRVKSTMHSQSPIEPKIAAAAEKSELALVHTAPASARPGLPIDLTVSLSDPEGRVSQVMVRFRPLGQAVYSEIKTLATGDSMSAQIPGLFVVVPSIDYYIAALDASGRLLAHAGSERKPLSISVREPMKEGAPVYKRWWFWTVASAVVVGGAAAAVATIATRGRPSPTVGTTNVTISFTP